MADKDLLTGKRILLVDDEPDVLDTLADLLPAPPPNGSAKSAPKFSATSPSVRAPVDFPDCWKPSISIWRY